MTDNSNGVIADDREVAERALAEYDLAPESTLSLLNLSENATYAVEDAGTGTRSILRVHRQNYHRPHEIESELDWLEALRRDSDIVVPTVLPASDGRRVVTVNDNGVARHVVHFEMVAGVEPDEETLTVQDFHTLGAITAAQMPRSLAEAAAFLVPYAKTAAPLDEAALGHAEGVVARSMDRRQIAKLRFEDYRRTLKR